MSNEYTPSVNDLAGKCINDDNSIRFTPEMFDRAIARVRAEAKAEALDQAAQDLFDWYESPFMCLDSCGDNTCPDDIRLGAGKDIQTWLRNRASQLKESK